MNIYEQINLLNLFHSLNKIKRLIVQKRFYCMTSLKKKKTLSNALYIFNCKIFRCLIA